MSANDNLTAVRRYLQAISSNVPVEEFLSFFSALVVQEEMPNRLKPQGDRRGLPEIERDYERGRQIIASQQYDVQSVVTEGETVAIEVLWTGRLAVAVAHLPPDTVMRAHCAIFFQFRTAKSCANETTTVSSRSNSKTSSGTTYPAARA